MGVATAEQQLCPRLWAATLAQGYYFSGPLEAAATDLLLSLSLGR